MHSDFFERELARFNRAYDGLFELLEDMPEAIGEKPGAVGIWSPKQVLAHLDGWVMEANHQFAALDAGQAVAALPDEDLFNASAVALRADWSWEEQISSLMASVDTLTARAAELTPEQWTQNPGYWHWFDGLAEDVEEHTPQLRVFLNNGV